jgi:cell wall-associated NlpC family hydrolase
MRYADEKLMRKTVPQILFLFLIFFSVACHTTKKISNNNHTNADSSGFYAEYSKKLGVEFDGDEDKKLIKEVAGWLGTPYVSGGKTKQGTDCSGFVQTVYKTVYNLSLYRTAEDLVKNCDLIDKKDLKTGDLVFFKIKQKKVSHVGIYLGKGKFIHASLKGVMINDLSEAYYAKYFYSGGRIKNLK